MRVFFSDLDGTLLNNEKQVSPRTRQAVDEFVRSGNAFVISTGRPHGSAIRLQEKFGLKYPGSYISAHNGALIYDSSAGKILYETGIPLDIVPEILRIADWHKVHVHTYQDIYIVSREYSDALEFYLGHIPMPLIINKDLLYELEKPPWKMIGVELRDHGRLQAFHDALLGELGDVISPVFSDSCYVDIAPVEAGKGNALLQLCNILNIPVENSMAAGDNENDLSMIRAAGLGIAMCNGVDELKKAADVVTEQDNNHDGLVPFLTRPQPMDPVS